MNILKIKMLPKVTYRCNVILTKIPILLITEAEKVNHKFHMEEQKTQTNQSDPGQKEQCWR